jgi:hypothetical protein
MARCTTPMTGKAHLYPGDDDLQKEVVTLDDGFLGDIAPPFISCDKLALPGRCCERRGG